MDNLSSLIIYKKSLIHLLPIGILLVASIFNFSISGLIKKGSHIFSSIFTILSLIFAIIAKGVLFFSFLNPASIGILEFANSKIALNGINILLCLMGDLIILLAFLICKKYIEKYRHRTCYLNSFFLLSALALNILIVQNDFTIFLLSLETLTLCALFMGISSKDRLNLFSSYKYLVFSIISSTLMILSYGFSNGFQVADEALNNLSKILFMIALLTKGGLLALVPFQQENHSRLKFASLIFSNTVILYAYIVASFFVIENYILIKSMPQGLFISLFTVLLPLCAIHIYNSKNFADFISKINIYNFTFILFLFFVKTGPTNFAGYYNLISYLLVFFAILSAGAIKDLSGKGLHFNDFSSIGYTNKYYSIFLSTALLVIAGIVPSVLLNAKIYAFFSLTNAGLWGILPLSLICISNTIVLIAIINFIKILHKRPTSKEIIKKIALKKRTKLNYSILFIFTILSIALCLIKIF